MKSLKQILNFPVIVLVLVAIFVGYKVPGTQYTSQAPVIAVVRIQPLFDGLRQKDDATDSVKERAQKNKAELEKRNAEIESLITTLKDIVDPDMRQEKGDEIGLKKLELKSWISSATAQSENKKGALLQELYKKVCVAVNAIALANGYTLVFLDDSNAEIEFSPSSRVVPQVQVLQQVSSRKILYVDPMIDITDQLITRMNNEFTAASAK